MGWDAPWHWIVLAIIVIALFGYKKLPDASRALGRSLRIFKTEIKGMGEDDRSREAANTLEAPAAPVETQPTPAASNGTPPSASASTEATKGMDPAAPAAAATPADDAARAESAK